MKLPTFQSSVLHQPPKLPVHQTILPLVFRLEKRWFLRNVENLLLYRVTASTLTSGIVDSCEMRGFYVPVVRKSPYIACPYTSVKPYNPRSGILVGFEVFTPRLWRREHEENAPHTPCIGGWVDPKSRSGSCEEENMFVSSENRTTISRSYSLLIIPSYLTESTNNNLIDEL
jgi:hypothetical protein